MIPLSDELLMSHLPEKKIDSFLLDCSQSPVFSWDRLDIPLLTVTAILIFKCTEGVGVGDYSSGVGGGGEKNKGL